MNVATGPDVDSKECCLVFRRKLTERQSRLRLSVHDLARELNKAPSEVAEALAALGEHVESDRKKQLEAPIVRAVYKHLNVEQAPTAPKPISQWQIRDDAGPRPQTRPRAQRPNPRQQIGDSSFAPKDNSLGIGDPSHDYAPAWASESWKLRGFTEVEKDAWIAAGLREGQVRQAARLRDAGFQPGDLSKEVKGWSVAKRIRAGESLTEIRRLLDGMAESTAQLPTTMQPPHHRLR